MAGGSLEEALVVGVNGLVMVRDGIFLGVGSGSVLIDLTLGLGFGVEDSDFDSSTFVCFGSFNFFLFFGVFCLGVGGGL